MKNGRLKYSVSLLPKVLLVLSLLLCTSLVAFAQSLHEGVDYTVYEVKPKDTVYSIAHRNGLKEQDIYRLNPDAEKGIRIGQKLRIPVAIVSPLPQTDSTSYTGKTMHTVLPGETLYAISRKYNIPPAILKQYNPDIDPDVLKPAMEIRIALSDGTPLSTVGSNILVPSGSRATIKMALLLPVKLPTGKPERYLRFYEGFLMALHKAKKSGISVDLDVYSTASAASFNNVLRSGELSDRDIIFGGQDYSEVENLSTYSSTRGIICVSPFISTTPITQHSNTNLFKLNVEQKELYPYIASSFSRKYRSYTPVFLSTKRGNHSAIVASLKKSLRQESIDYLELPLSTLSASSVLNAKSKRRLVFVLDDSGEEYLKEFFSKASEATVMPSHATLFGYPEWQSFESSIKTKLATLGTTIYSSFFFPTEDASAKSFVSNYKGWYNKEIDSSYPKFSVLGYDTANFFITALINYGTTFINMPAQVPSDGLQTDFIFRKSEGEEAFSNLSLFFITFQPNGKIKKERMVY